MSILSNLSISTRDFSISSPILATPKIEPMQFTLDFVQETPKNAKFFSIENRRYIGSKAKLAQWIKLILQQECPDCSSFLDVFSGTGIITKTMLDEYDEFVMNDLLYSNEVIYQGFFLNSKFDFNKLLNIKNQYNKLNPEQINDHYFSDNFGGRFFSHNDARKIGLIRDDIEERYNKGYINEKEKYILLSSLIYSADRISNTVGHYEAYIKGKKIPDEFSFELIKPIESINKKFQFFRKNANDLVSTISADIAFVDPPYNSRQYSRFYHVLETLVKWDEPELFGVAMKPKEENMSDYCRNSAPKAFEDLINKLKVKYIAVTYNNTYTSKSSSSKNKISLSQITEILEKKGETKIFDTSHKFFNAGKTEFDNHKEYLFITKVK